jgi:hypothetical protein
VSGIRRREFIILLGGSAAATWWPLAARAQQGERVRRIGVLTPWDENKDSEAKTFLSAFRKGLAELGWIERWRPISWRPSQS